MTNWVIEPNLGGTSYEKRKITRRSFLLGLAACSAAGVLTACKGSDAPASSASAAPEAPASSVSEVPPVSLFAVEDFPKLDGSTACIPLMAQMMADTTGIDLEAAQSAISVSTTAYAWESFGLYPDEDYTAKMLVVYEAPDYVKDELKEADAQLEQKPIGRDALVFIVNEENPVKSLTRQQLKDIYAGKITNWKEVGGDDLDIVAFQRSEDSGSQTLFKKLLIQGGELMDPPTELAPTAMGELVDSLAAYTTAPTPSAFRCITTSTRCTPGPACGCWPWMESSLPTTPLPARNTRCATNSTLFSTQTPPLTARSASSMTGWTPTPGRTASRSPAM